MITISIYKIILLTLIVILTAAVLSYLYIEHYREDKDSEIEKIKKEYDELFNTWKLKEESFQELKYQRQFEWWKRDWEAKHSKPKDRVTLKLTGNERMTIDYTDIKKREDGFLAITDKDNNLLLLNMNYIREVRFHEREQRAGNNEDDKG